jgi:hypothetical protein
LKAEGKQILDFMQEFFPPLSNGVIPHFKPKDIANKIVDHKNYPMFAKWILATEPQREMCRAVTFPINNGLSPQRILSRSKSLPAKMKIDEKKFIEWYAIYVNPPVITGNLKTDVENFNFTDYLDKVLNPESINLDDNAFNKFINEVLKINPYDIDNKYDKNKGNLLTFINSKESQKLADEIIAIFKEKYNSLPQNNIVISQDLISNTALEIYDKIIEEESYGGARKSKRRSQKARGTKKLRSQQKKSRKGKKGKKRRSTKRRGHR